MNSLDLLHPVFRNRLLFLFDVFKKNGIDFKVTSTYRTQEEQKRLEAEGYPVAKGRSPHLDRIATDISIVDNYQRALAKQIALDYGFRAFDYPDHPKSKYALHIDVKNNLDSGEIPAKKNNAAGVIVSLIILGVIVYMSGFSNKNKEKEDGVSKRIDYS